MNILDFIWLIPAFPLLAFAVNGLFGRMLKRATGPIACVLVGLSFLMSLLVLIAGINRGTNALALQYSLYTLIPSGDFHLDIGFLVDPHSSSMRHDDSPVCRLVASRPLA